MKITLIIIFSLTILSCEKKITKEKEKIELNSQTEYINQTNQKNKIPETNQLFDYKYCFVVFEGQSYFSHEGHKRIVTNIFESKSYLNKDEEYKLIDDSQIKSSINLHLKNVNKRYIKYFYSYSEANKEREKLLGINQPTDSELDNQNKRNDLEENYSDNYYFVTEPKAYFYSKPNIKSRKNTYLLEGAQINVIEETEYFVYTIFTNTDGVTSKGWVLKNEISKYY